MALQTRNLVMIGLSVLNDSPPNAVQPALVNGIHLRWAFERLLGFPWYGFHLFRRNHLEGDLLCLSEFTSSLSRGSLSTSMLNVSFPEAENVQISSDQNLFLTDDFRPREAVEFNLAGRSYLRVDFLKSAPTGEISPDPARRVEVRVGLRSDKAEIEVSALLWDTPIARRVASGRAGDIVNLIFEFDAITAIQLGPGAAALVELCFVPVSQSATAGWQPVSQFSYPMALPVTHPDYPCTSGVAENIPRARALARSRIRYGDSAQFTSPPVRIQTTGTISVVNGSSVVIGTDTQWANNLVGAVLQVTGDPSVYTIVMVVNASKLVLSRNYAGTSQTETTYVINQDAFEQFYDQLIHLVTGSSASGPMVDRFIPLPVSSGTVRVRTDDHIATGVGTSLGDNVVGLILDVVDREVTTGTVSVISGFPRVMGNSTNWGADLVGLPFQILGERTTYVIKHVDSSTELQLNRGYAGGSGGGKAYTIVEKTLYVIESLNPTTQELTLDRAYAGQAEFGAEKTYTIFGKMQPEESGDVAPRMPRQYPLDFVLLATLHPAVAQMVGLYWIDQTPDPSLACDYLIVADYEGLASGSPGGVRNWVNHRFDHVEAYIVFNKRLAPSPSLVAPDDVRVYALPGGVVPTQPCLFEDATNNTGLRWNRGVTNLGILLPGQPVMYNMWRSDLGNGEAPSTPGVYNLITKDRPVIPVESQIDLQETPRFPNIWPPFPLQAFDRGLRDGWYSYQISGIDIFGRHSANSAPAQWWQWAPRPDPPPRYYQDPPSDRLIHPFAVRVLDELGPPAPTAVEAYALDPRDPTVLRDAAYTDWWRTLSDDEQTNLIGLRVRWLWTYAQMQQAPDTREFRIYYQPGELNALLGHTRSVTAVTSTESSVETDIVNTRQANAYIGTWLQIGTDSFEVIASDASSPLRVRVKSGPVISTGTIAAENGSPRITGSQTNWDKTVIGLTLKVAEEDTEYTILKVEDPPTQQFTVDRRYVGATGGGKAYTVFGKLPRGNAPCTIIIPPVYTAGRISVVPGSLTVTGIGTNWDTQFAGAELEVSGDATTYTIARVDSPTQLVLDRQYEAMDTSNTTDKKYIIRHPHPLFDDYSVPTKWEERYHVVDYNEHVTETVPPIRLPAFGGRELQGSAATANGTVVSLDGDPDLWGMPVSGEFLVLANDTNRPSRTYRVLSVDNIAKTVSVDGIPNIEAPSSWRIVFLLQGDAATAAGNVVTLDANAYLSDIRLVAEHLFLANDRNSATKSYCITGINNSAKTVTLNGSPNIGDAPSPWAIGSPLRAYEIFLPDPTGSFRRNLPLTPTLADPIAYAHIGVSAADDKHHTLDNPRWSEEGRGGWGGSDRYGNEGPIGAPARIFRVRREQPPAPVPPPPDSDKVFASPADYHGHSFYTYRWKTAVDPRNPEKILPLRCHIFRALDDTLFQLDWSQRPQPIPLDTSQDRFFPDPLTEPRWDNVKRQQVADELNQLNNFTDEAAAMSYYQGISNDGQRVLAGLPGNDRAFTQLTIMPLDPDDPTNADRRGPDSPDDYEPNPDLRAYVDTLDGRASGNRYFYRAAYVDGANNRSELSLSTVPIYLRNTVPPRTPVITKILGGDRQIAIRWASNREPDLREYRVYLADSEEAARDLQLMTLVHTELVPSRDPAARPAEVEFVDTTVIPYRENFYRLLAIDEARNASPLSTVGTGRAYDYGQPNEPTWERSEWVKLDSEGNEHSWTDDIPTLTPAVAVTFTVPQGYVSALVQRQDSGWRNITSWRRKQQSDSALIPWRFAAYDTTARPAQENRYRAKLMNLTGAILESSAVRIVLAP